MARQDNTTQMRNLLEQQERIITDLISRHNALPASIQTGNAFFVKDDYPRIVIEIEVNKHIGQTWPCQWSSIPMLADALMLIVAVHRERRRGLYERISHGVHRAI